MAVKNKLFVIFLAMTLVFAAVLGSVIVVNAAPPPGDVNNDKKVDGKDAVYLYNHYNSGANKYPIETGQDVDFNGDGKKDANDAVYLLYHVIFGAEKYPLYSKSSGGSSSNNGDWSPDII